MKIMPAVFGSHMYMNQMLYSESVVNASAALQTVWETPKPDKHTTENMRMLFNEIICDLVVSNRTTIQFQLLKLGIDLQCETITIFVQSASLNILS